MEDGPVERGQAEERRIHTRERIKIRVQYRTVQRLREEWVQNISHGGIFIRSMIPLDLHQEVEVSLYLPSGEQPITLIGEVVRIVTEEEADKRGILPGFALEFKDFSSKKQYLDDFIRKAAQARTEPREPVIRLGPPPEGETVPPAENAPVKSDEGPSHKNDEEGTQLRAIQVKNMSVKDKMILAPKADRADRAILLRDLNASVARLLIRNPRITESEIAQIAKDFSVPADVLEAISKNRKWVQNPEVRLAVVKNPRTPTPLALVQLNFIQVKDLAFIAKSQHVREAIKNEALKLLLKKRETSR
jgi:hypothetical protein